MLTLKLDTMLGNVPEDWGIKPLKKLLSSNQPGDWGEDGGPNMVRVLRSTNLTKDGSLDLSDVAIRALDVKKAALLSPRKDDILVERSGGGPDQPVGRVGFVPSDMPDHAFSNFLHLLRPDPSVIHPRFLAWVLYRINQTGRILRLEQQTTQMRNLHFRDYLTMPLPVPPPDEQSIIASVLDAVDLAAKRASMAIQEARDLKKALIQGFFYNALGETAYADRPSKPLPSRWSLTPMRSLLTSDPKNGISPATTTQPPGVATFSIAAIRDGRIDLCNRNNLKYAHLSEKVANNFRIARGDLLIVRGNANVDLVGKCGLVSEVPTGCIYPDITMRVVFRREGKMTVTPEFAALSWNHPVIHNQILRRAKTSNGTLKINNRDVSQIILPVPPPDHQELVVEQAAAADTLIDALNVRLRIHEEMKRSLLRELLIGETRVDRTLFKEKRIS